jgi:hypothetical protein
MRVSVLVPAYNAGKTLAETLDSALAQSGEFELEVLVVDDGSTDATSAVLDQYRDRVTAMHQANAGAGAARNRLTGCANGDWLLYLDADDRLVEGTVARRLAEGGDADVVHCHYQRWSPDGQGWEPGTVETFDFASVSQDAGAAIIGGAWAPPGAFLFRREAVVRAGAWSSTLRVLQDARFLAEVALSGARFVTSPHVGLEYRETPDSLSRSNRLAFHREILANAEELEERMDREGSWSPARNGAVARCYQHVAREIGAEDADAAARALAGARRRGRAGAAAPRWLRAAAAFQPWLGPSKACRFANWLARWRA